MKLKSYWEFIKEENSPAFSIHNKKIGDFVYIDGEKIKIIEFLSWTKNKEAKCIEFEGEFNGEKKKFKHDGVRDTYIFEFNDTNIKAGKHTFISFLKVNTSLGLKDIKPNWDNIPDDFLLFFEYISDYQTIISRFQRFNSLQIFTTKIPQTNTKLYYGLKLDNTFSFGFYDNNIIEIGNFNLNKNNLNYLLLLQSISASHLKKELAYINSDNLKIISKITKYIKNYHIGNTEERKFEINNGILEFKYKGLTQQIDEIKNNIIDYLLKSKLSDKILISIKKETDWVKLSIKLK